MATADQLRQEADKVRTEPSTKPRDGVFRFTLEQYERLFEMGFFEGRRVELIRGVVFEMTINTPHATASRLASYTLRAIFGLGWVISDALPLKTDRRSLIEPDLTVVAGSIRDFAKIHPSTASLVVEISDSTLRKDRTLKAHVYAQANLPEYWIVNLIDRQLEVHREPGRDPERKGRFRYASVTIVPESGTISPLAAPESVVPVSDLLP